MNTAISQGNLADTSEFANARNIIKDQTFFIGLNPKNINAYLKRSYYNQLLGNFAASVEDLNKILELDPSDYRALNSRAVAKEGIKDKIGAAEDYSKAIALKDDFVDAYYGRGVVYYRLHRFTDALNDLNKCIELDSTNRSMFENFLMYKGYSEYELQN